LVGVGFGQTEDWIYKPHIRGVFCSWDDGYGISFISDTFFKFKEWLN
jgi:hypothetical protein